MKIVKIESLCEVHNSHWTYADELLPKDKYKYFYEDGSSHTQDYVLTQDLKQVGSITKVKEFSE